MVFPGNVYIYGHARSAKVSEDHPRNPCSRRGNFASNWKICSWRHHARTTSQRSSSDSPTSTDPTQAASVTAFSRQPSPGRLHDGSEILVQCTNSSSFPTPLRQWRRGQIETMRTVRTSTSQDLNQSPPRTDQPRLQGDRPPTKNEGNQQANNATVRNVQQNGT